MRVDVDVPRALTHISTGVVYASPGVVNMPPCVLCDTQANTSVSQERNRMEYRTQNGKGKRKRTGIQTTQNQSLHIRRLRARDSRRR